MESNKGLFRPNNLWQKDIPQVSCLLLGFETMENVDIKVGDLANCYAPWGYLACDSGVFTNGKGEENNRSDGREHVFFGQIFVKFFFVKFLSWFFFGWANFWFLESLVENFQVRTISAFRNQDGIIIYIYIFIRRRLFKRVSRNQPVYVQAALSSLRRTICHRTLC